MGGLSGLSSLKGLSSPSFIPLFLVARGRTDGASRSPRVSLAGSAGQSVAGEMKNRVNAGFGKDSKARAEQCYISRLWWPEGWEVHPVLLWWAFAQESLSDYLPLSRGLSSLQLLRSPP